MFMGSETQREQGLHHLEMIKKLAFPHLRQSDANAI
ncbi:hypothetical protein ACVW02_003606 [Ewingella americana]